MLSFTKEEPAYNTLFFNTVRSFFPDYSWQDLHNEKYPQVELLVQKPKIRLSLQDNILEEKLDDFSEEEIKWSIKRLLFKLISATYSVGQPSWGILTGIRPGKVVHRMLDEKISEKEILDKLENFYLLTREKSQLLYQIAQRQRPFLPSKEEDQKKIAIYISIPFCSSICSYCTFGSWLLDKHKKMLPAYLENLFFELEKCLPYIKEYGFSVDKVYIGGGTPSILHESQLNELLSLLKAYLPLEDLLEFTFEAGRPDSLNLDKLKLLKEYGVKRISINPQIMSDEILNKLGRRHSVEDIKRIYLLAKAEGISEINMDLIMGLEEKEEDFFNSLNQVLELEPENITIHSLAFKRKASMQVDTELINSQAANKIFAKTLKILGMSSYEPYYLYKQKLSNGGQENIGFAREGKYSPYNILMIEERQTILGFGCGASSKLVNPLNNKLENFFSTKDIYSYREKIEESIAIKKTFLEKTSKELSNGN